MLEAIRRFGVEKRWVFGLVLGLVTVTFVGTMGWMGMSGPSGAYAAKAGGEVVLLADFERSYKNAYRNYQQRLGDQFSDELMNAINLKMQVLMGLIDHKLWLAEARRLGLSASDAELRDALMDIPAFQASGRFNSRVYLEALSRIHMSPEEFENGLRDDIVVDKVQSLVASAAEVTAADVADAPPPQVAPGSAPPGPEARRTEILDRKRAQVVAAYTNHLRVLGDVHIYRENLSL
jgi:peptidyl-prolyl cis-trans isomerase D